MTEVVELLGWLRGKQVEVIRLRESIDQDSATGRVMLHLAAVFTEIERDLARVEGLGPANATGNPLGRKGVGRRRA